MELNKLSEKVIGACIEVHKILGAGLLESIYQTCLVQELKNRGLNCKENVPINIIYKGAELDKCFFVDILVDDKLIIELKAIEVVLPVHKSQLLSYLKLSNIKLGLLVNFNVPVLKNGITRIIN